MVRFAVAVLLVASCGGAASPQAPEGRRQAAGNSREPTGAALADAGVAVTQVTPDAGAAVVYPDAGLVEMGAAQCEMVIARIIACPSVGAEMKQQLEKKRAEIRQLAVDPKNRESLGAACRQLVEAMEETLRRLSC